ncbi:MAG: hypothetical protein M3O46_04055 [Myxococcota bacterium]|nr:hypothetical protein [Myxococcota bacterium]
MKRHALLAVLASSLGGIGIGCVERGRDVYVEPPRQERHEDRPREEHHEEHQGDHHEDHHGDHHEDHHDDHRQ